MPPPYSSNIPKESCTPISSQCVIWQGPDIPCISLCQGDSIDEVVFKLASLLCDMAEPFIDLSTIDFKCIITNTTDPTTVQAAFQAIVDYVCSIPPPVEPGTTPVIVRLPECLRYTDGDGQFIEYLELSEYASFIAGKLCIAISDINTANAAISALDARVTALEDADPVTPAEVQIQTICVGDTVNPSDLSVAVLALEEAFCELRDVTGLPTEIVTAIGTQCASLGSQQQLSGDDTMSAIVGWQATPTTAADALTNIWLTICDMRTKIISIADCCAAKCSDLFLDYYLSINTARTTATLIFNGLTNIPVGMTEVLASGIITVSDGTTTVDIPFVMEDYRYDPAGIDVDLAGAGILTTTDLSFTVSITYTNGTTDCTKSSAKTNRYGICIAPALTDLTIVALATTSGTALWTAPTSGNTPIINYTVTLKETIGGAVVVTYDTVSTNSSFSGLTTATSYTVEVIVNYTCGSSIVASEILLTL